MVVFLNHTKIIWYQRKGYIIKFGHTKGIKWIYNNSATAIIFMHRNPLVTLFKYDSHDLYWVWHQILRKILLDHVHSNSSWYYLNVHRLARFCAKFQCFLQKSMQCNTLTPLFISLVAWKSRQASSISFKYIHEFCIRCDICMIMEEYCYLINADIRSISRF